GARESAPGRGGGVAAVPCSDGGAGRDPPPGGGGGGAARVRGHRPRGGAVPGARGADAVEAVGRPHPPERHGAPAGRGGDRQGAGRGVAAPGEAMSGAPGWSWRLVARAVLVAAVASGTGAALGYL